MKFFIKKDIPRPPKQLTCTILLGTEAEITFPITVKISMRRISTRFSSLSSYSLGGRVPTHLSLKQLGILANDHSAVTNETLKIPTR